jgi:hypothetical protein
MRGTSTSAVEVTNISKHGFWVLIDDHELFLPFETFPWFKAASVDAITHVRTTSAAAPLLAGPGR